MTASQSSRTDGPVSLFQNAVFTISEGLAASS